MVTGSASLRYKLALSEHGMCDEPRSRIAAAEKLELLTAHAAAWSRLHDMSPEWATSLVGWSAPAAVSDNILVFSRTCDGIRNRHEADIAAPVEDHLDLLVVRVPSLFRRIDGAQWMLWLPASARELCIDAVQDLLVYVLCVVLSRLCGRDRKNSSQCRDRTICVRTLSTGVVHPLVVGHSGCFKMWEGSSIRSLNVFDVCVCGDYVAAGTHVFFISVWNWKTGALVSDQVRDQVLLPRRLMFLTLFQGYRCKLLVVRFSR